MQRRAIYIDCTPDPAELLARIDDRLVGGLDVHYGDPRQEDLPRLLEGYPLVLNGHTRMPRDLLAGLAPGLEKIVFLGTGAANFIDLAAARDNEIAVETIANYGDRSVAEHAFALMLASARSIASMDRSLRAGQWLQMSGMELQGKTVGVVGLGGIGSAFASMAERFGMRVVVWNRSERSLPDNCISAAELYELFAQSDVVSLHLAYSDATHHLIGADLLTAMQPGSILINTARAELVDLDALVGCLTGGPLGHAAVDVYETEPAEPHHPLLALPNVTLTAHAAWKTPEASRRLLEAGLTKLWAE